MTSRERSSTVRRPWHLWIAATIVFALYVGGARDYLIILIDGTANVRGQFGRDGVRYFADYPGALRIIWTINVLGDLSLR